MTTLRAHLRHAFAATLAIALLAVGATDAHATHFRYGTIRWEQIPTNPTDPDAIRVKVTAESAWRRDFPWPSGQVPTIGVPLNTGYTVVVQTLANVSVNSAPLQVTPSSINTLENWFVGSSQLEFQFARGLLPVRVFFDNNARISTLRDGNNDRPFRVESIVSATPNAASPASSILPIITVGVGPAVKFFIPAADVEGDTLTWSIAPLARSRLVKAAPDGSDDAPPATLTINSATGEVTWATNQELPPGSGGDLYAVQFIVTDSKGAETPVDALLRLVPTTGNPPQALINGLNTAYSVSVRPNNPVSFTVTGSDVDAGSSITLNSGALPPGATMTPTLPTTGGSPTNSTFNWTPTLAQAGNNFVVSFSATDNFGLQDTNSATITVLNNFPPLAGCNADVSVEATGASGATVTLTTTVSDLDSDALVVKWFVDNVLEQTDNVPASSGSTLLSFTRLYSIGAHSVRVEVSDGLVTSQCTTLVTITDNGGPTLHLPADQTLEATGPGGAVATWSPDPPIATDVVDGTILATCDATSGTLFPIAVNVVTCSATDSNGNTTTGTFTITVQDTTPPVLSLPADITLEATGPTGAVATFTATATDIVDGSVAVTCAPPSGNTFPIAVTTVNCSATDAHSNTSSGTFTVTVQDTTPPVLSLPADITLEATGPTGAVATFTATATDIVDGSVAVTCAPSSGSTFPIAVTTVNCSATDAHGNSSSGTFLVTVQDTTRPVLSLPADITNEATSPAGAVATFTATATDIVDGPVPVTCVPPSGSTFPLGVNTVTCTATDSHGNTATGTFLVTVVDTTPPVIANMPADMTREATSPSGASASWDSPTATDIVDVTVPVICAPASGSTFAINPPGPVTTVTCTATDAHGNSSSASFTVTVVDTTPPVILNMPGNMTVPATGPGGAIVTWPPPNATDIVDVTVPVNCVPASGTFFPIGNTPVTCTATDAHGNSSSAGFIVRVADSTPPVVTVTLSPGILWPPDHRMIEIAVTVRTTDTDPNPSCVITNVTSNQPVNGTGDGDTDIDWAYNGLNLKLRRERAGNSSRQSVRIYTVTVSCTDSAGNVGVGTATAIVPHDMGKSTGTPGFSGLLE